MQNTPRCKIHNSARIFQAHVFFKQAARKSLGLAAGRGGRRRQAGRGVSQRLTPGRHQEVRTYSARSCRPGAAKSSRPSAHKRGNTRGTAHERATTSLTSIDASRRLSARSTPDRAPGRAHLPWSLLSSFTTLFFHDQSFHPSVSSFLLSFLLFFILLLLFSVYLVPSFAASGHEGVQ